MNTLKGACPPCLRSEMLLSENGTQDQDPYFTWITWIEQNIASNQTKDGVEVV